MDNTTLTCTLELAPAGAGEVGLAFQVRNPGRQRVTLAYYQPYLDFDLTADGPDGRIPVLQPPYDVMAIPATLAIDPGKTARLETPFHLRFDPHVDASGGEVPTIWTIWHEPVPVRLRATLRFDGATVAPCELDFDPRRRK